MRFLCADNDPKTTNQRLFSIANYFFRYCFSEQTFDKFSDLLLEKSMHPVVRLFLSVIWVELAGTGWRFFHKNTLKLLKKEHQRGKRIIYVGGGSDIYQLIKQGIYNVTIIDPQLPSQLSFYAAGWQWLVKGEDSNFGIGDEIHFTFQDRNVVMKRIGFSQGDTFRAHLSDGSQKTIKKSKTTWVVYDDHDFGIMEFDRRFVDQSDFENHENKALFFIV